MNWQKPFNFFLTRPFNIHRTIWIICTMSELLLAEFHQIFTTACCCVVETLKHTVWCLLGVWSTVIIETADKEPECCTAHKVTIYSCRQTPGSHRNIWATLSYPTQWENIIHYWYIFLRVLPQYWLYMKLKTMLNAKHNFFNVFAFWFTK